MKHRGMGCVYARGGKPDDKGRLKTGSWWIRYYRNGEGNSESAQTLLKGEAQALLKRRIGEIANGQFIKPAQRRVTVGELVCDMLQWYRAGLSQKCKNPEEFAEKCEARWNTHLSAFFSGMRASEVGTDQLRQYRNNRMAEENPPSPTTVNQELQVLRKAYKLAANSTPPKVRHVPAFEMADEWERRRKVFISEADKQKLKEAAARDTSKTGKMKGLHLRAFVELMFSFGWRKGELVGLKVGNVSLLENLIRIETSKTGESREVPLTNTLRLLLQPLVCGKGPQESLWPAKDMRYAWKRLCKNAGVRCGKKDGGYIIHDARRTAARTKRSAGVNQTVIEQIMGWKPGSKMFARYGIVDRADMEEALERAERWEQRTAVATEQLQSQQPTKSSIPAYN